MTSWIFCWCMARHANDCTLTPTKKATSRVAFGWLFCRRSAPFRKSKDLIAERIGPAAQSGHEFALLVHQELVEVPVIGLRNRSKPFG